MALAREQVLAAIQEKLETLCPSPVKVVLRRVKDWSNTPTQPAIVIAPEDQTAFAERGQPLVWTWRITLLVYVKADKGGVAPDVTLNGVLDAIEEEFEPAPGVEAETLNGLVQRCSLSGTVAVGVIAETVDQYVAEIPLEVIATA